MTEFETRALAVLDSIDQTLKKLATDVDYISGFEKRAIDRQLADVRQIQSMARFSRE